MSELKAEECTFPNGSPYVSLTVHGRKIGIAEVVDGGYLAWGRRKPVATIEAAAKQLLDAEISKRSNEVQKLRAMLNTVLRTKDSE